MAFARDIQFENNILNASAEGTSAIFIGIKHINAFCVDFQTVIRTSASIVTNETRVDKMTVAYATVKAHPCIMNIYLYIYIYLSQITVEQDIYLRVEQGKT